LNTPTHALIGLALLARRGEPVRNRWVLFGSLLPDIPIFVWGFWHMFVRRTDPELLWGTLYFAPPMQLAIAPWNSIPAMAAGAAIGWAFRDRRWAAWLGLVCVAALIHIAFDVPVHSDDAYRHFWPLSDWRYESPLSYWNSLDNARWVTLVEGLIALACGAVLWRRFPKAWKRALTALFAGGTAALSALIFMSG
jgi:hypothetical protein